MSVRFIEESAATGDPEITDAFAGADDLGASTAAPSKGKSAGLFVARLLLSAALAASPHGQVFTESAYTGRRRWASLAVGDTAPEEADPVLVAEVRDLFDRSASEFFVDGVYSEFYRDLTRLIVEHGRPLLRAIADYLYSGEAAPDVASEALRWLPGLWDAEAENEVWAILQTMLRDRSSRVRDGAILGFAALDDPRAVPVLLTAQTDERLEELRRLIGQVVAQLDATENATAVDRGSREPLA